MTKKQKKILTRIIISSVLTILALVLPIRTHFKTIFLLLSYIIVGYDILIKAFKGIFKGQALDENFLMSVATIGAMILSDFFEGVAVILLYQIGELFQSLAVGKSRKNIKELMDISPEYANLENENGEIIVVLPEEVKIGSIIVVKPGEKIPIDGIVVQGISSINTAALTGESLPRDVNVGDEVISGSINTTNVIKIRTTKIYADSTVSKILELIENSGTKKSQSEKFISKFAKYYTPIVCISALLLAFLPPLLVFFIHHEIVFDDWIYRALTFLVISCPCALVISIPLTFFSTIGGAGKNGILIKGSNYIETLSKAVCVVFDKTGTLTKGCFKVIDIEPQGIEKEKLLEYTALAEIYSNHPISVSIRKEVCIPLDSARVKDIDDIPGKGVIATVDNKQITVGNLSLMESNGISIVADNTIGTKVYVAIDGVYAGRIIISDEVKPTSKSTIENLRKTGVKKTVMLTGDSKGVAESVSKSLGIDEVYSELFPNDKVAMVEKLLSGLSSKEKLVYIGDGINDAPVLARADVGIAMGAIGSDCAIEAADIVLLDDNPINLVSAIKTSKKCMKIVYQNIVFAIAVKFICLSLGALGLTTMWTAIFADVGVMLIAVINSMRALKVKN